MKLAIGLIFAGCLITLVSLAGGAVAYAMVAWVERRWPETEDAAADDKALFLADDLGGCVLVIAEQEGPPLDDDEEEAWLAFLVGWHEPEAEVDR